MAEVKEGWLKDGDTCRGPPFKYALASDHRQEDFKQVDRSTFVPVQAVVSTFSSLPLQLNPRFLQGSYDVQTDCQHQYRSDILVD